MNLKRLQRRRVRRAGTSVSRVTGRHHSLVPQQHLLATTKLLLVPQTSSVKNSQKSRSSQKESDTRRWTLSTRKTQNAHDVFQKVCASWLRLTNVIFALRFLALRPSVSPAENMTPPPTRNHGTHQSTSRVKLPGKFVFFGGGGGSTVYVGLRILHNDPGSPPYPYFHTFSPIQPCSFHTSHDNYHSPTFDPLDPSCCTILSLTLDLTRHPDST